jgi:hypothetical protein
MFDIDMLLQSGGGRFHAIPSDFVSRAMKTEPVLSGRSILHHPPLNIVIVSLGCHGGLAEKERRGESEMRVVVFYADYGGAATQYNALLTSV